MPNFTEWHLTLPWGPEVFFPVVCGENWAAKLRSWRAGKNPYLVTVVTNSLLKQDNSPNRFFVGSVCFRNWTCLHEGQWCVKRRVMQWNWGMANFVSGVSITPVKRLTSVNSVYSVNNFCRVWNVNLLYNKKSGYGKFNLFDGVRSKEQNIAQSCHLCWDFPSTRRALLLPFCAWNVEGNWTNLKSSSRGLVSLKRRLIRRLRSREKWKNGELT